MSELVEFLRARLDEDEQTARECGGAPWSTPIPRAVHVDAKAIADNKLAFGHLGYVAMVEREHDRQHIARHDPATVLARCDAELAVLALYEEAERNASTLTTNEDRHDARIERATLEAVIQALAQGYQHRDGWQEKWAT